ncbi:MAG: hypothetical protein ACLQUY_17305 [Ktedonobacterales bacterium]
MPGAEPEAGRADIELATKLAEVDMQNLYTTYLHMWDIFATAVRLMLLVISFPILSAGVLISAKAIHLEDITNLGHLPYILVLITLGSGVLGVLLLSVIVHYRLDILLYARGINGFRGFYAHILEKDAHFTNLTDLSSEMPTTTDIPEYFEPLREVGILVLGFACINSVYITLAFINLAASFLQSNGDVVGFIISAAFGVVIVALQYYAYYLLTQREPIAGSRGKKNSTKSVHTSLSLSLRKLMNKWSAR